MLVSLMISICLNRCFVFPRNSEYLETLNDDKESSLQFCVCPQKKQRLYLWKGMEHRFEKRKNCKLSRPWHLWKNEWVKKGRGPWILWQKKWWPPHNTTTNYNRVETGSLLRIAYVNQPTEELRRQFLWKILRFSKWRDSVAKSSTITFYVTINI